MDIGIVGMYVMIILIGALRIVLRINASKLADTRNIARIDIGEDEGRREFIASGVSDANNKGSKILVILYSLMCRKCDSSNIYADISEDKEHIEITCKDCGYITIIPLKRLVFHEDISPEELAEDEERAVREYIRKLHAKHEIDIIDPPGYKK